MSESELVAVPTYLEKLMPGQTHAESAAMLGRGSLVFLAGMAMAAASFFVERAVVKAVRKA